jgi:hypothetical protein
MVRYQASASLRAGVAVVLALSVSGIFAAMAARAPAALAPIEPARIARTASVNDTGHLHLVNASGSILNEAGAASGTLPGRVRVRLTVRASVTASFTLEARGGSIVGHGSAVLHSSREFSSFGGSLSVDRGTGRYAHAGGGGKLYGVIDRGNDALTVQTVGQLHY